MFKWRDLIAGIVGNATWDLIKFLGCALTASLVPSILSNIEKLNRHPVMESVFSTFTIFVLFCLGGWLHNKSKGREFRRDEPISHQGNLKLEFVEGLVGWRTTANSVVTNWACILLRVRVTPVCDRPISIKEWEFDTVSQDGKRSALPIVKSPSISQCSVLEREDYFGPAFDILPILINQPNSLIPDGAFADYAFLVGGSQPFLHDFFKLSFEVRAKDTHDCINIYTSRAGDWLKVAKFS